MIGSIAGGGLPILAALLIARRLDSRAGSALVTLPIALGLAFGLSSALFFAFMLLPLGSRTALLALDTIAWIAIVGALIALSIRRPISRAVEDVEPPRSPRWVGATAVAVLFGCAALALTRFVATSVVSPHGAWDAWAFWNAHARALFLGYPDWWRRATLAILHPDYPLLTPAAIARIWQYAGRDAIAAPIAVAAAASAAVVLLLGAAVAQAGGATRGVIAAAALLAAPAFTAAAASQFADVPIAFYFLATLVAFDRAIASGRLVWWIAAGASAGFAAWTKNEGQAFCLVSAAAMAIVIVRDRRQVGWRPIAAVALGVVPGIAAIVLFRRALPFPHEVFAGLTADRVQARLQNLARWRAIGSALGQQLWFGGARMVGVLPIVAAFAWVDRVRRPVPTIVRASAAVLVVMLVAYTLVYLFSPYDLAWHLGTSADRVVVQLVPSAIWVLLMWSGTPERRR